MMGCRHGAKNTLDLTYLYLAEKHGAQVFPETRVVNVKPLDGDQRWQRRIRSVAPLNPPRGFAASRGASPAAAWSSPLLRWARWNCSFSSKKKAHCRPSAASWANMCAPIPNRSSGRARRATPRICRRASPSAPASTLTSTPTLKLSAIPSGSDAMGFLTTILTDGRPGPQRIALWLKNVVASLLRHPFKTVRVLQPLGWAREFVILLCMQALDGEIEMRWQRPWFWPFRKFLVSRGEKVPTYIPKANEFAQKFAQAHRRFSDEHASGDPLRCSGHGALYRRLRDRRFFHATAWSTLATASSATRICTSATDRWWRPTSASIPA